MFAALFVALVVPIGAFIAFYNCYYKRKNLPPGPMPLPFFGNSLALMKRQPGEDLFLEWRHKFGNIFTFWLGETPIVCIAEYGKMVEHYQRGGEPFSGRHAIESYEKIIRGGILGVLQTEGDIWRELRRFTLHVFRDFGVGKNLQQERILTEIEAMFKQLDTDIEVAAEIEIVQYFERSISSIINALLVGFRFDETKEAQYHQLNGQLWRFNNRMQNFATNLFMWKPDWFKSMPYCRDAFALVKETHNCFFDFFDEQIRGHMEHLEQFGPEELDSPPTDFMRAFLREKLKRDRAGEKHNYTFEQLKATLFDLWISGQETTTTALAWGVAYMVHNPDVMEKIHEELEKQIGKEQQICWADRLKLPYTAAAVNEVLRVGNVVAQDFPHRMMRDTRVDKWTLRRGQPIVAQISVVLMDPEIFPNPKAFQPERFLDEHGNMRKTDELIPFALGKRQCLGESLARMEMFLFFANILNRYKISAGHQMPSLERRMGIPVLCPKFTCRVEKRCTA
uniref:Cytochrome P450 n=1 Tax=Globodera pallida TaxID=36090 RepID=A0A183C3I7_GLOPA